MASDEKDSTHQLKNEDITEDIKDNTDIIDSSTSEKKDGLSEEEKAYWQNWYNWHALIINFSVKQVDFQNLTHPV